ncbi:Phospholipase/carboxylesterase/thioesterase [Leptodontidium sp. MPI-SDFR-AT-0119]|nr:Phospholipase/carboxylesterase/thioesterase [Leptodontidium sp. MPI-SDFR-AT-0119]
MEQKGQKAPQRVEAQNTNAERPATFIFLHGFGDDADGFINIAHQFQSARKLPHLSWIFPNAPHNHDANSTAWYTPTAFSPIPIGSSSPTAQESPEDDESNEPAEGEDEIWTSVGYIEGLIEGELKKGVKLDRIVVGGFSQGCAVSLLVGLAGRFKGSLGGVVGLSGYLPPGRRVWEGREELRKGRVEGGGEGKGMRVFMGHGTKDMLVPMRIFRNARERVMYTVGEGNVDSHEYQGLGHTASGAMFRDMCGFLEKVIPE